MSSCIVPRRIILLSIIRVAVGQWLPLKWFGETSVSKTRLSRMSGKCKNYNKKLCGALDTKHFKSGNDKLPCMVLRGERGGNASDLPGLYEKLFLELVHK